MNKRTKAKIKDKLKYYLGQYDILTIVDIMQLMKEWDFTGHVPVPAGRLRTCLIELRENGEVDYKKNKSNGTGYWSLRKE